MTFPVLPSFEKDLTKIVFTVNQLSRGLTDLTVTVGTSLTAAGATQATATVLTENWNTVTTVAAGTGVQLNASADGIETRIYNFGANSLKVYPPVGGAIDALGTNNPFVLASGKQQIYSRLSATFYASQNAAMMG